MIAAKNWQRDSWFDETSLPWINPSPNMRNLIQATLYPGIGAIETTNISVGRGTDTPFEQFGAPWIDATVLADALNGRRIPGVGFYPVRFTPASSKYAGQACQGVFMIVTDRAALRPVRLGVEIAAMLHKLYGEFLRARCGGTALRLAGRNYADSRRGGSGVDCRLMERCGGAVAAAPGAVSAVSLSFAASGLSCHLRQICRVLGPADPR